MTVLGLLLVVLLVAVLAIFRISYEAQKDASEYDSHEDEEYDHSVAIVHDFIAFLLRATAITRTTLVWRREVRDWAQVTG